MSINMLDQIAGWLGYQPIAPSALGNPQTTVTTPTITANAGMVNLDQLKPIIDNNPMLQTLNQQSLAEYLNQNKIGLSSFQNIASNADATKQLIGAMQNNQSMMRPDALSMEGFLGNKNYAGWGSTALQGISSLGNLYLGYKGLKNTEKLQQEQIALQRANYRNTAKAMNNQYRDQLSGRGYNGMSQGAVSALGQQYNRRKVAETY